MIEMGTETLCENERSSPGMFALVSRKIGQRNTRNWLNGERQKHTLSDFQRSSTRIHSEGRTSARRLMKYCEERRVKGLGWRDKFVGRAA